MAPDNIPDDEMRQCPTCRSEISVWATKCKHCGVEVGRPRVEETKLTLKDLGGETQNTYTVSGNVMDALESFRAEELSAQEEEHRQQDVKKKTWFGKRKDKEGEGEAKPDPEKLLPELDSYHKELAEGMKESTTVQRRDAARRAQEKPAITKTIFIIAAIAAGLVLLYLGGSAAVAGIKGYIASRNVVQLPDCASKPNRAMELLNRGGEENTIEALEAAMDAVSCFDSAENLRIAEVVRVRFIEAIDSRFAKIVYNKKEMHDTSNWMARASAVDADNRIQERSAKVLKDVRDYGSLNLLEIVFIDGIGQAKFVLRSGGGEELWVKNGKMLLNRFNVTGIRADHVLLEDTNFNVGGISPRKLVVRLGGEVVAAE